MTDLASAMAVVQPAVLVVSAVLLGIASLHDVATRSIPDSAAIGLAIVGLGTRVTHGDVAAGVIAAAAVMVLATLCWRCGWIGGGDAKLLASCALVVSPALVPQLVVYTALAGGILACVYIGLGRLRAVSRDPPARAGRRSHLQRIWRIERWRIRRRAPLPYGCAIAAATLVTLSGR